MSTQRESFAGQTCRYCAKPILAEQEGVTTHGYWWGNRFASHRACKDAGVRQEAFDCQMIDADCNDCRHFQRGEVVMRWLSCMEDGKAGMKLVNMGTVLGHCLKFDRPTKAYPNMATGRECFEHRRAPQTPLPTL